MLVHLSIFLITICVPPFTSLCNSLQICACMSTCIIFFLRSFMYVFSHVCISSLSAALWNQLCVFTLPGLPAPGEQAACSHSVTWHAGWQTPVMAMRPARLLHDFADIICTARWCAHTILFVWSLSGSVWPVVHAGSTCFHFLVYLLQESQLPAVEQSGNISSVTLRDWDKHSLCPFQRHDLF